MGINEKFSLRSLLTFSIALIVLITVAMAGLLGNALIGRRFEQYMTLQQTERIQDIVGGLEALYTPGDGWNETLVYAAGMSALYSGYIIKVYDVEGAMVWDAEHHDTALCGRIMDEISVRMSRWHEGAGGHLVSERHQLLYEGREIGSVTIGYYGPYFFTETDFEFINALGAALGITAAVALVFAAGVGALMAARIAQPVVKSAGIAGRIAAGDYEARYEGQTDSRELVALTQSINSLAATLQAQEALRKRLTGDVAHELRTPLAAVSAHLEAMTEGVWEPTPDRLRSCQEEIERLGALVSDLEALAGVESGDMKLELSDVDLSALARDAGRRFELEIQKKRLSFVVEGEAVARGDASRLSQVVANLMSNAVKYTPEGGHIRALVRREGAWAVLEFADDGIGIPENALPLVFERFYRVDKSRSRRTGGAGIGLAIVQSIVRAHGGTVEARSREGEGSRFIVRLPAA